MARSRPPLAAAEHAERVKECLATLGVYMERVKTSRDMDELRHVLRDLHAVSGYLHLLSAGGWPIA